LSLQLLQTFLQLLLIVLPPWGKRGLGGVKTLGEGERGSLGVTPWERGS